MGVIKSLLGVVILLAIAVFGYWLYATYTIASSDDQLWTTVNSNMPDPLRKWSCTEVNARIDAAQAPEGCADAWKTAGAAGETVAPSSDTTSATSTN